MKKSGVFYQIKMLGKLIGREFIHGNGDHELVSPPTPTQMLIMDYIVSHLNDNIYQKDLEDVLKLRRATVSGVLQTMEKHGLIRRIVNENDARSKRIVLNEKTINYFKQNEQKIQKLEQVITADISDEEIKIFNDIIVKMQKNIINYEKNK